MSKTEAKKRIEKLREEINRHRYLYHVLDQSEISDAAHDSLMHELAALERQYPDLVTSDSPSQRVAGKPLEEFAKVKHPEPILSIEDIFSFQELSDWQDYMTNLLPRDVVFDYFCERKIDGIDIVLTYKKGVLVTAATRGDGLIGEDVTQNIKTVEAVPLRLEKKIDIVVRGEIFVSKKDFNHLNAERKKKNLPLFANPRNITAGSVRQLDPKITASRKLDCFIFEIITDVGQKTHQETHEILRELGLKTDQEAKRCVNLKEVEKLHSFWQRVRPQSLFDYDGMVVVLNNLRYQQQLGAVGKSPRWMRAYKFPAEQATTIVKDVIFQVGRTGVLTPVALFKPTPLMGSVVSRATLHNEDEIKRLDVRLGDTVIIQKAGDVIPDIVQVLKNLRTGKEKKIEMPKKCPICGGIVKRKPGEAGHYCLNKKCFATEWRRIVHFVSKRGFDIDGLGQKIVEQLINVGLIKDPADIFVLTQGDLEPLERFAEKSAQNLIEAINRSKKIDLARFIHALGIRHVGEETALLLAEDIQVACRNVNLNVFIEYFRNKSIDEWQKLSDVGSVVAHSLYGWFHQKENIDLIEGLKNYGVQLKPLPIKNTLKLKGKIFVLTGELISLTRDEAKEKVRSFGGDVSEGVSKKTNFVVLGNNPGSKYQKAQKLGVKIINEKDFLQLLKV